MPSPKINIAIFISGRGSNMQALLRACADKNFPAQTILVLSNRPDAEGLSYAKNHGIETAIVDHKKYPTRESFEDTLLNTLKSYKVDLICLAGFMRILTPHFIKNWQDRILNIHPSLLPDYKGLNTHERAIKDEKSEAGCTVHYVIPEMDSGEIIVQKRVPILSNDTPETLSARVLEQEHIAYPEAVRIVSEKLLKM